MVLIDNNIFKSYSINVYCPKAQIIGKGGAALENTEYIMRYILSALALAVIANCVWSLIRLRPSKKVYALLQDMANDNRYPITCYETSIGRSKSCDVVFSNTTVSRSHAVISLRPDGFYVFDTESKTGVYVNGEKINKKARLSNGDHIAFGTAIMNFYIGSDADRDMSSKAEPLAAAKLVNLADGSEFDMDGDFITIGRQEGSNIELGARYVSRRQAELSLKGGEWYIEDFGSVTKTTVNGDPIYSTARLKDGDVIKIGDFAFLFGKPEE